MSERRGFFAEYWIFLRYHWAWWLVPILLVLLTVFVVALSGVNREGGFDYGLF